uniref:SnoaL-like domain-containing protein n=1 Tax=Phaeodactylum tricornutum TaxID=2850 RepID=A0A8J9X7L3_PHATR
MAEREANRLDCEPTYQTSAMRDLKPLAQISVLAASVVTGLSFSPLSKSKATFPGVLSPKSSASSLSATTPTSPSAKAFTTKRARDLVQSLVEEDKCYVTEAGARAFAEVCAPDVLIEDRFFPQPYTGKTNAAAYITERVAQRKGKGEVRIDRISDGDIACGFAWTWTCGQEEGLRGTTFVELNENGQIKYIQEIPEPLFKPGNLTKELLRAVTQGAEPKPTVSFEKKAPTAANEVAKYLYVDLQNAEPEAGTAELMRFLADDILYRDFNFQNPLTSPAEVKAFVDDFSFPGIEFRPLRFDDGDLSTCFTWEVVLDDAPDTVKGMSFYELDPETRKIVYVRDVPESAIKPPILGKLARDFRPGLGVFRGVPLGSRPGGK